MYYFTPLRIGFQTRFVRARQQSATLANGTRVEGVIRGKITEQWEVSINMADDKMKNDDRDKQMGGGQKKDDYSQQTPGRKQPDDMSTGHRPGQQNQPGHNKDDYNTSEKSGKGQGGRQGQNR